MQHLSRCSLICVWLVCIWLIKAFGIYASDDVLVRDYSPFCERFESSLTCDFTEFPRVIHLDKSVPPGVSEVVIKGGKMVFISVSVCADMTLTDVEEIRLLPFSGESCKRNVSISIHNVTTLKFPITLNNVIIEDTATGAVFRSSLKSVKFNNLTPNSFTHEEISQTVNTVNTSGLAENHIQIWIFGSNFDQFVKVKGNVKQLAIDFAKKGKSLPAPNAPEKKVTSKLSKRSAFDASLQNTDSTMPQQDSNICIKYTSYFEAFIACLCIFLLSLFITVTYIVYLRMMIKHIDRQQSSPDLYDYRKDSKVTQTQLMQSPEKNKELANDDHLPMLDVNMEKYQCFIEDADELNTKLSSSLRSEKLNYLDKARKATENYMKQLEKLKSSAKERQAELESSKQFELKNLETQYEDEFDTPTMLYWEKIKHLLEKTKAFNSELINERYALSFYEARVNDNTQRLQERANVVQINKDFIGRVTVMIREHLSKWPSMLTLMKETNFNSSTAEEIFKLLEYLITSYQIFTEQNYDRRIREQDNKYLIDFETQEIELSKICSSLKESIAEEKDLMQTLMSEDLESKLPWTKKYIDTVENLYGIRDELLDVKLKFQLEKANERYSETKLKLTHLNVILNMQDEHSKNLERLVLIITDSLTLCERILKLGLFEKNPADVSVALGLCQDVERQTVGRISRQSDMFMDRYAQA